MNQFVGIESCIFWDCGW